MRKAYGFKLQSQKNVIKLGNMIDDMWGIHLHIMLLARRYRRLFGKDVSAYKLKRHVAKLKKRTKPHWKDLPSQVVQDVVLRYGKAQDAFFQNIKDRKAGLTTRKVGRPRIKPRHKYNSMTFTQAGYTLEENRIKINCIGTWFSFHKHRDIEGTIFCRYWNRSVQSTVKPSCKSDNGLPRRNLAVIVVTITKTFLFQIGSGHVPNVVHTTTETSTLLSTSNGQAWLPKVERLLDVQPSGRTLTARKRKPHALACGYH